MNKIIFLAAMLGVVSGAYAGTAIVQLGAAAGAAVADTAVSAAPVPASDIKVNCNAYPAAPGCPAFCRHHHGYPGCSRYGKSSGSKKIEKASAGIPAVSACTCKNRKGGAAASHLTTEGKEKGRAITADPVSGVNEGRKNSGSVSARHGHGAGPDGPDEVGPEDGTGGDQGPAGGGPDDIDDGGGCGGAGSGGGGDDGPDGSGGVYF